MAAMAENSGVTTHPAARKNWVRRKRKAFADVFRPAPRISVSEWSETFRVLSRDVAAEPGPWRNERVPYLVEIMDALSDPTVKEMVIVKCSRVGYTEGVIANGIGYFVHQDPSPIIIYQPTDGDATDWSKKHLDPMIRDTKELREKIPPSGGRKSENTILDKFFPGGSITIRGGQSPRNFRRMNARIVMFDEVSALVANASGSGDPVRLGETRAASFPNRKIVKGSTPLVLGTCRITKEFEYTDQRYWHVPCPHCGEEQRLEWGDEKSSYGIKWDRSRDCKSCGARRGDGEKCDGCGAREIEITHHPETAYYLCRHCACPIEERHKSNMVKAGRWVATEPQNKTPGWFVGPALLSLVSDKARWPTLAAEWLKVKNDPDQLQTFVNEVLGEPWEERGQSFEPKGLRARVEDYRNSDGEQVDAPAGVGVLTASVDVQEAGRLELLVRGWGDREECWLILHERVYGNVRSEDTWARLEPLLVKPYMHEFGAQLRIQAVAVDSGSATDAVYSFVLPRQGRKVHAIKGRGGQGEPPLKKARTANKDGVRLFTLGVDTLKDTVFARLRRERPGPGYYHFCVQRPERYNGVDAEYFEQLGAEKKIYNRKKKKWEYIKVRERNEGPDLEVYALGALHMLGAGVRQTLGDRARKISQAGTDYKEVFAQTKKRSRRVRSKGVQV